MRDDQNVLIVETLTQPYDYFGTQYCTTLVLVVVVIIWGHTWCA